MSERRTPEPPPGSGPDLGARIVLFSVIGAVGLALAYLVLAGLGSPPFHDERAGFPGIPGALQYAIGTRGGVLFIGTFFFGAYGAAGGIVAAFISWLLARSGKPRS